ncbi:MAG: hypothetical protein QT10_C0001G0112 [archaeon GW2011_AR19]|nr:MAG: hypothetical protein QT10_C0001G0112 [archaeon GW2011_AR19]
MVNVKPSEDFEKILSKLDKSVRIKINKLIDRIILNPKIGKHMMYDRKGTMEVYAKPFRLSYSYDKNADTLYLLDLYHKKKQ